MTGYGVNLIAHFVEIHDLLGIRLNVSTPKVALPSKLVKDML